MVNPTGITKHDEDTIRRVRELAVDYVKPDGTPNFNRIAKEVGVARSTVTLWLSETPKETKVEHPEFITEGDEEEHIHDILSRFRKAHARKKKAAEARSWYQVKVRETKPYGILWFGDPHLGPHCDWETLERHIDIANQDGVYGANIGDTTDNWPWTGRLARLWAEADISTATERRLAKWFMMEAGIDWLVWLIGNHDEWNGGAEFYKMLGARQVPVMDWRAQFTLVHPNGSETRVDAAHGRRGTSIYNPTHSTLRDAKFGEDADLFITGHIHTFGLFDIEFAEKKRNVWLAQVSGYKMDDHYAKVRGFAESRRGSAILSIVYPETGGVQCFADVEAGARFLESLRS